MFYLYGKLNCTNHNIFYIKLFGRNMKLIKYGC
jgi:hypothetical protein